MNEYPDHIVIAKLSSLLYGFNQFLEYVIDLIIVVQFFKDLNSEFICVAFKFLISQFRIPTILNFPRLVFSVWNMSSSKLKPSFGGRGGVLVGFGGLIRS